MGIGNWAVSETPSFTETGGEGKRRRKELLCAVLGMNEYGQLAENEVSGGNSDPTRT